MLVLKTMVIPALGLLLTPLDLAKDRTNQGWTSDIRVVGVQ